MKLIYGISRWTNSSRPSAIHIANTEGRPLCNSKRKVFCWEREDSTCIDNVTCDKCKNAYAKLSEAEKIQLENLVKIEIQTPESKTPDKLVKFFSF